jgi:opacity protein-like surface antigen
MMKRSHWITGAAAPATFAALLAGSRPARAEVALGGDFDVGLPVAQTGAPTFLATGAGFDVRLGYRFRIPYQPLWITPQISAGYTDLAAHLVRVRPGVRVAFGGFVMPYAQVHVGYGWASFDPLGTQDTQSTPYVSAGGLAFDAAAGVDFAILRRLHVGAHLGYNIVNVAQVSGMPSPLHARWLNVGLDATFFL